MARNGSGVYTLPTGSWNPAVAGTDIDEGDWNTVGADLSAALSESIASTGVTTITANLPMSGKKHTNVGAASARTQYAQVAQIQDTGYVYAAATDGGADAYVATLSPAITAYTTGMQVRLLFNEANTTAAPTIQLNGIASPKTIKNANGSALAVGQIGAGTLLTLTYNGTDFVTDTPVALSDSTYTPTLTNSTNIDASTAYSTQVFRVGAMVTTSGRVDIDTTAGGGADTLLGMSIPYASNFANLNEAGGGGGCLTETEPLAIYADSTNDRLTLRFKSQNTNNRTFTFTETHRVI